MFGSRTLWDPGRYITTSGFPKDMHVFGLLDSVEVETESWMNTYHGVDLNTTSIVPGAFSCTNSWPSCTWRKVMDVYNINIFNLPKHNNRICRAFCILGATHCSKDARLTLFETCLVRCFTTSVLLSKPDPMNDLAKWIKSPWLPHHIGSVDRQARVAYVVLNRWHTCAVRVWGWLGDLGSMRRTGGVRKEGRRNGF